MHAGLSCGVLSGAHFRRVLVLDGADSSLMTLSLRKGGGEICVHNVHCQILTGDAGAERQHVGIVMLSRQSGLRHAGAERASDSADLIGSDGDADSCRADDDSLFVRSVRHRFCNGAGILWIIAGSRAVTAVIRHFMSLAAEVPDHLLLESISAVIRSDSDFHNVTCPPRMLYGVIIPRWDKIRE